MEETIWVEVKKIEDMLDSIKTQQKHKKVTKMKGLLKGMKVADRDIEEAKSSLFKFENS